MITQLRDGSLTADLNLDRIKQFDPRSRQFAVMDKLAQPKLRNRAYRVGVWLDQGYEGACVGFAMCHLAAATPHRQPGWQERDNKYARAIYYDAQRIDPWPGGEYPGASPRYSGTSVLAGIKVMQARGLLKEYRWAFGEEDLAYAVSELGPAVIGINWYDDMYFPNQHGFIRPTGTLVGGHAILVQGVNFDRLQGYMLWNSWGKSWGVNGRAFISRTDMRWLLEQQGEAVIPVWS